MLKEYQNCQTGFQALRAENYKNNIWLSFPRFYINILFASTYIINITLYSEVVLVPLSFEKCSGKGQVFCSW